MFLHFVTLTTTRTTSIRFPVWYSNHNGFLEAIGYKRLDKGDDLTSKHSIQKIKQKNLFILSFFENVRGAALHAAKVLEKVRCTALRGNALPRAAAYAARLTSLVYTH